VYPTASGYCVTERGIRNFSSPEHSGSVRVRSSPIRKRRKSANFRKPERIIVAAFVGRVFVFLIKAKHQLINHKFKQPKYSRINSTTTQLSRHQNNNQHGKPTNTSPTKLNVSI